MSPRSTRLLATAVTAVATTATTALTGVAAPPAYAGHDRSPSADARPHGHPSLRHLGYSLDGEGPSGGRPGVMPRMRATPQPVTPYEMPFPCGQTWTGTSRPSHSPSPRAIDWNSPNDLGKPVVAAAAGTVTTARTGQNLPSYGQYVVIDHGHNESTLYGHLSAVTVSVGDVVAQGDQIGNVGSTGNSTGPHLHFEERSNGIDVDAWFHGALFPMNTSLTSQNCGAVAVVDTPVAGRLISGVTAGVVGVFRHKAHARFRIQRPDGTIKKVKLGVATDDPVIGDWDANGADNLGVWSPSTGTFQLMVHSTTTTVVFGGRTDLPVAGNWDGIGGAEVGLYQASIGRFLLRSASGSVTPVMLGGPGDLPVTGDWDGNGSTDLGVFDPATATFTLRVVDAQGTVWTSTVQYGAAGDRPVAADWDADGITDLGVWDPSTATFSERVGLTAGRWAARR